MRLPLPNFLIGGASQSGTTFLASSIVQHPDVYLPTPVVPECHFFYKPWEFEKGLEYYSLQWFSGVDEESAIGEKSTSYLFGGELVAKRIAQVIPKVKLIFVLRNPIERTWSSYRFAVYQGLEQLSFREALSCEETRAASASGEMATIQPHSYIGRSLYSGQLRSYYKHFSRDQILVIKAETLDMDRSKLFQTIFQFLGVCADFAPGPAERFSTPDVVSPQEQARIRARLGDRATLFLSALRGGSDGMHLVQSHSEEKLLKELQENIRPNSTRMNEEDRAYLRDFFEQDSLELKHLVPFDTYDWA